MSNANPVAEHWAAAGDVYALIVNALKNAGKDLGNLTVEDLAPVDHFHARPEAFRLTTHRVQARQWLARAQLFRVQTSQRSLPLKTGTEVVTTDSALWSNLSPSSSAKSPSFRQKGGPPCCSP